jgi:hypothetical protein
LANGTALTWIFPRFLTDLASDFLINLLPGGVGGSVGGQDDPFKRRCGKGCG